jgi:hypothetical protein
LVFCSNETIEEFRLSENKGAEENVWSSDRKWKEVEKYTVRSFMIILLIHIIINNNNIIIIIISFVVSLCVVMKAP